MRGVGYVEREKKTFDTEITVLSIQNIDPDGMRTRTRGREDEHLPEGLRDARELHGNRVAEEQRGEEREEQQVWVYRQPLVD